MIRYENEKTKTYRILDLTGLTRDEFEQVAALGSSNQMPPQTSHHPRPNDPIAYISAQLARDHTPRSQPKNAKA